METFLVFVLCDYDTFILRFLLMIGLFGLGSQIMTLVA